MASGDRTYQFVDGRWLLTLHRRDELSFAKFVVIGLGVTVVGLVFGSLSTPVADRLQAFLGERTWAPLILSVALFGMLAGLHRLILSYLPDHVEVRNPGGSVVQSTKTRPVLWKVFGAIYVLVVSLALFGAGFMERAHG
ncbi:hypothetical protein [Defluviimonas sp. SAOS-178_SWC]|uniref:hypothetical protein n=1 Tax=Defluviimonas sp. SAOS-178_SWC TaxID=3121287 RepID=UPI003221BE0D